MIKKFTLFMVCAICALVANAQDYPENLYIIGSVTEPAWNPETGIEMTNNGDGIYTAKITTKSATDNIAIVSVLSSDWDNVVNQNRWGFAADNSPVTIGEAMPIVKGTGAIRIGAVGTFDVTVNLAEMTILVAGEAVVEYPETMYIIGSITEPQWNPLQGIEMTVESEGVYKAEITTTFVDDEINFVASLGENEEDWTTINANRWGFSTSHSTVTLNEPMEVVQVLDNGNIRIGAVGTFDVTFNMVDMSVLVEGEAEPVEGPEAFYVIGTIHEDVQWNPSDGSVALTKDEDANIYRGYSISIYSALDNENGYGFFSLASQLGENETDWDAVKPYRYGPAENNTEIIDNTEATVVKSEENAFMVEAAVYDIVFDYDNQTITLSKTGELAGVEELEGNEASVVAGDGEIRVNGDATVSIYNVCGQRIAADSNATSFSVPAGVYVVVVNGKATKVAVK